MSCIVLLKCFFFYFEEYYGMYCLTNIVHVPYHKVGVKLGMWHILKRADEPTNFRSRDPKEIGTSGRHSCRWITLLGRIPSEMRLHGPGWSTSEKGELAVYSECLNDYCGTCHVAHLEEGRRAFTFTVNRPQEIIISEKRSRIWRICQNL